MAYKVSDGVLSYDAEGRWMLSEQEVIQLAALVAAAEKELIAQWVESWGNDLTIKEIVEGIRTDGNGTTRPLKYVTRNLGEG